MSFASRVFLVADGLLQPGSLRRLAEIASRQASASGIATVARMLGRFRHLEAPEEQPEGEQDDLERCDGKDKDTAQP